MQAARTVVVVDGMGSQSHQLLVHRLAARTSYMCVDLTSLKQDLVATTFVEQLEVASDALTCANALVVILGPTWTTTTDASSSSVPPPAPAPAPAADPDPDATAGGVVVVVTDVIETDQDQDQDKERKNCTGRLACTIGAALIRGVPIFVMGSLPCMRPMSTLAAYLGQCFWIEAAAAMGRIRPVSGLPELEDLLGKLVATGL